jgi:DNA-binding MarR family transcriptional regulator
MRLSKFGKSRPAWIPTVVNRPISYRTVRELALFRYHLRRFIRFSEEAARKCGVTPQQHQLMLGVAAFTGRKSATISDLAEFLQEQHHSVTGLVGRAVARQLVVRRQGTADRRQVLVFLTEKGETILSRLTQMHSSEMDRIRKGLFEGWRTPHEKQRGRKP